MEQQPQAAEQDTPVRVRVLIRKISQWLEQHPEALVAAEKGRLVINISGGNVRIHVEQIYDRI